MNEKSLVTVQIVDLFGAPIPKAQYEVKNQKTGQLLAKGATNSKGCIVEISRDKGTTLDIYIKSMFNSVMVKIQSFTLSKDRMLVKITSPKALLDLKTLGDQGSSGQYKRKTHVVKKGESLTTIAKSNQTTVIALTRLNNLKDPNKLNVGQVLKMPINLPATGNNAHHDKPILREQPIVSSTPSEKGGQSGTEVRSFSNTILDKANQSIDEAKKALDQAYEEGKKALLDGVGALGKIFTTDDRSQEGGTPKADAPNLCKTNPQCISSGKSELIREINIRLAGFGGALPTDEFTELTAKCIKQFQRDYMGVPETGKICGSVLTALDKFYDEYPIAGFMAKAACNCGKCSGYGNGKMEVQSGQNLANEYPGLHRSLIWILKALDFYLKNEFKDESIVVAYIESGYRCIENNKIHKRTSVNHMGLALDIHFNKNGERTRSTVDMEFIRKDIMNKKMGAVEKRGDNKIYLEPAVFASGASGAKTWVHFDITRFEESYFEKDFFKKTVADLNGSKILLLANTLRGSNILRCVGIAPASNKNLTDSSLEELIKQLGSAISHGEGNYESYNTGTINNKVIHSYLHPGKGTVTNKTIDQIIQTYNLSPNKTTRMFAVGKYQITPSPMKEAKLKLKLTGEEKLDAHLQERIFREYLIPTKRPILGAFVLKGQGTVKVAQYEASKEWASVATPEGLTISKKNGGYVSDGTKSFYESKANHANIDSTKMVKEILERIYQYHQELNPKRVN